MKHYVIKSVDELFRSPDLMLPSLFVGHGCAYMFHYHTYNVTLDDISVTPPSELSNICTFRVVFQDAPLSSMSEVDTLWNDMIDELHYYDKLRIRLLDFHTVPVTPCTNCGEIDIIHKRIDCALCGSPLCVSCYEAQPYCHAHLN